ncbi:hypothetical protein [Saccharopolyspora spinosa]|uniref:hypothetical protein n=1 Tax=Saccharopolyspora spinosa TaxID=60894 RepID=UPI0002379569|nr:hypothetical protein [Saccharopolyspora spinosa]
MIGPSRAGARIVVRGFVHDCVGVELLESAGVTVIELPELADAAMAANAHLRIR